MVTPASSRSYVIRTLQDYPLSDPILVNNRYGREDLLALVGRDSQPPDGLETLGPFLVAIAQKPIVLTPLNDIETVSFK